MAARFPSDVICGDANFLAADPDGFLLGMLSSSMFIAWMRAVGGRLESRLRFSGTFTHNTFPLPATSEQQRAEIAAAAALIIVARDAHPASTLAELYEPGTMPAELAEAHDAVDRTVDALFGSRLMKTQAARQEALFERYAAMTD
jgi:hypothetical protein